MAHAQYSVAVIETEGGTFIGTPTIGQPFIATQKTTSIQKLADGTSITHISTTKEARDSQGRMMNETKLPPNGAASGNGWSSTFVVDPAERTTTSWFSQQKQATRYHQPDVEQAAARRARAIAAAKAANHASATDSGPHPTTKHEQLGGRNIAGIYAEGTRITTTYPVGSIGNDKPIVVVSENWISPDLKLTVLQTNDDPRSGSRTVETTQLDRSEPDPALFQAPEGYTIKDIRPTSSPE
ncbi:MAG TPA: hypothetical protein VGC07_04155 [Granulicella sp.]